MADDEKAIILHAFHSSSCAWRVRLGLAYKEIPYEYKAWNLSKGEHLTAEYQNINANQLVPALEIDGTVVTDSIAILEFLEERFPDKKPLLPKDLLKRAAVRSFANTIAGGIQPLQNLRVLNVVAEKSGEDARLEWAQKWIIRGFNVLEFTLGKTAGKYCFGDEFTLADVLLVPQLNNANRFKVDMGKFPVIQRVSQNLYQLELVLKSKPEHQPDYPSPK